jgi:hypothetical protein
MLRDPSLLETPVPQIAQLAAEIRDKNYRIFTSAGEIHLVSSQLHLHGTDPFTLMEQLLGGSPAVDNAVADDDASRLRSRLPAKLDPGHAFYLGYEMSKARTALTLGKNYQQDEPLQWGLATRPETRHYLKKKSRS